MHLVQLAKLLGQLAQLCGDERRDEARCGGGAAEERWSCAGGVWEVSGCTEVQLERLSVWIAERAPSLIAWPSALSPPSEVMSLYERSTSRTWAHETSSSVAASSCTSVSVLRGGRG